MLTTRELFARREEPLTSPFVGALILLSAALVALGIGAGLMALVGANPLTGYRELLLGMAGSRQNITESLLKATPLLVIALGIAIAFTASIWNIGAEGQFYMGALFSTWVALSFAELPMYVVLPIAILVAGLAGGMWGGIAGYLRAKFDVNEIIVTVMLNYVAIFFVRFMVDAPLRETEAMGVGNPQTNLLEEALWLPRLIPRTRLHVGFVVALVLTVAVYLLLRHTTFGYRLRAVGKNPVAARYAGINVQSTILWSMVLSGAFAGFAGFVEVFGVHHRLLYSISPGYGYLGIIVALLGQQNALGIALAATLLAALNVGGGAMQRGIGVPESLVTTIEYLMVLLLVAAGILQTHYFVPWRRLMARRRR